MEIRNLSDAEFKTVVLRCSRNLLSEDLSSIKMTQNDQSILIQSETKDTLIEIKNNLQGNNSRVDEGENEINDMECKEAKKNQSEQQEEKNPEK